MNIENDPRGIKISTKGVKFDKNSKKIIKLDNRHFYVKKVSKKHYRKSSLKKEHKTRQFVKSNKGSLNFIKVKKCKSPTPKTRPTTASIDKPQTQSLFKRRRVMSPPVMRAMKLKNSKVRY